MIFMKVTKEFKKEDGTRYRLSISIMADYFKAEPRFDISCSKALPNKRKFQLLVSIDDYGYRSAQDKKLYEQTIIFSEIEPEWLEEVKSELISEIKKCLNKDIVYFKPEAK